MRTQSRNRAAGERGAITIHVAIALIALLSFVSIVVDYGLMWVSRRQAQNAADAGALAGAIALIREGGTANAKLAAAQFATNNPIWGDLNSYGAGGNIDVAVSGTGANETSIPPCGTNTGCVRVDVFRNEPDRNGTLRGTALPTFFGRIFGLNAQGVRATATAQTANGNSIRCLLPFAVIDRWADNYDESVVTTYYPNDGLTGTAGWTQNDYFQPAALNPPTSTPDVYVGPYAGNVNPTGWTVTGDFGRQLILKSGSPGLYSSGWAAEVDLPNSTGSNDYEWNIENCNPQPVGIATADRNCGTTGVDYPVGCISVKTGVSQGPTSQGIGNLTRGLVSQDPTATWSTSVNGGPAGTTGGVVSGGALDMDSPRIRPIAIIDINDYIAQGCSGTTCVAKVANIIGFFVEGMCNQVTLDPSNIAACPDPSKDVVGRIVTLPGTFATSGTGTVGDPSAFIKVIRLVR